MPAIFNIGDFLKIGVFTLIFIWLADKALGKMGLDSYKL